MKALDQAPMNVELTEPELISPAWIGIQRWLLRIGAFLLPLIVVWDGLDRFILPKLLAARLLAIALAVFLLTRGVLTGRWSWRRTALDVPVLALMASTAISSVFSVNHNVALFGVYLRYEGLLTVLTYATIFWLTVQLIPTREDARTLGWSLLAGAYVVSLIAIFQTVTGRGIGPDTSVGGYVRAFSTFGSPVELGTFLAMLLPLAFYEAFRTPSLTLRLIAAHVFMVLAATLILTFTRAAWFAALIGVVIVLIHNRPRLSLPPLMGKGQHNFPPPLGKGRVGAWLTGSVALVTLAVLVFAIGRTGGPSSVAQAVSSRAQSTTAVEEGSTYFRLHLWSDSLRLLSIRPLLGSGPDSFGLVYPSVQSGNWAPGMVVDKAHNDIIQVAVTNGLVGVLASYLILATIAVQFWRNRRTGWPAAMLAGLIAYEVALQAEFSWVPTAVPFWLFAAAAFYASSFQVQSPAPSRVSPSPLQERRRFLRPLLREGHRFLPPLLRERHGSALPRSRGRAGWGLHPWQQTALMAVIVGAGAALAVFAVVPDLQADRLLYRAVRDRSIGTDYSAQLVASARRLNPHESVYAVAAGNLALDLQFGNVAGPRADLVAARAAYQDAADLGTTNPAAFRGLAIADFRLGDRRGAIAAASRAVGLNRFDPANLALLRSLETHQP